MNFLFLSLFVYLLKNCSSQFFCHWKSAKPVFYSEELSCLPYKNQNKSLTLSFREGKFKFAVLWGLFIKQFFHWAPFSCLIKFHESQQNKPTVLKLRYVAWWNSKAKSLSPFVQIVSKKFYRIKRWPLNRGVMIRLLTNEVISHILLGTLKCIQQRK